MQYDQVIHNLLDRTKSRTKKKKRRLKFLAAFFFLFYFFTCQGMLHYQYHYYIIIIIIINNIIIIIIIRNTLWVLFAFVIMLRHFIKQRKNKQTKKKIRENFFVSTSRVKI